MVFKAFFPSDINLQPFFIKYPKAEKVFIDWASSIPFSDGFLFDTNALTVISLRGLLSQFIQNMDIYVCEWFTNGLIFDLFFNENREDLISSLDVFFSKVADEYGTP